MPVPAPVRRLTEAGHLAFERKVEVKHEFFDGEVFMMSGFGRIKDLAQRVGEALAEP